MIQKTNGRRKSQGLCGHRRSYRRWHEIWSTKPYQQLSHSLWRKQAIESRNPCQQHRSAIAGRNEYRTPRKRTDLQRNRCRTRQFGEDLEAFVPSLRGSTDRPVRRLGRPIAVMHDDLTHRIAVCFLASNVVANVVAIDPYQ